MKTLFVNTRYLIVPTMTCATILGLIYGGIYVWVGVFLFVASALIDTATKNIHLKADFDEHGNSYGIKIFQYGIMYLMFGVFISLQLALAWRIYQYSNAMPIETYNLFGLIIENGVTTSNLIGSTISAGLWAGIGIIYGHELSHNKKEGFLTSRLMMALSGASHFTYAHVYNHHLDLGHEDDPATAPRGRNVYAHTWLSHAGQSYFLFEREKKRFDNLRSSFLNIGNKWVLGYLYSLPSILLFVWVGGGLGLVALLSLWIIANFELEALNFMGHYGLIREKDKPVEHRHSWDNDSIFTDWFFIAIGRQSDHHVRGETYFWELDDVKGPNYGIGYFSLFLITLVPAIFRKYVKKHLVNWDATYATAQERKIAKQYGY